MKTAIRYEIRSIKGSEYSRSMFRQLVERPRALRIIKRLKRSGITAIAAPMKITL